MYKSKLQELCQKKAWNLPEYGTQKQGQDHNPRFEATVTVNGKSFQSQVPARSSKAAQNDAAELAFHYFTSPPLPDTGSSNGVANSDSNSANMTIFQPERQEEYRDSQVTESTPICKDKERSKDMQHLYKNLLQHFAQKNNLNRPVYSCEFEGPPHASRFRCKVTINEKTYESLEFFPTIKEAEHAAAKVALSCLSPDALEEEDPTLYKNLLQELTQKESCPLPVYTTTRSGEAHASTFVSVVEVKGEVFTGQTAKTKKQAEFSAAKVAYMKLKDCKSNRSSTIIATAYSERAVPVLSSSDLPSHISVDTQRNFGSKVSSLLSPSSTSGENQQERRVDIKFCNHSLSVPFPQPEMSPERDSNSPSPKLYDPPLPKYEHSTSNMPSNHSVAIDFVDGSIKQPVEMSTLSCNRVIVRPRVPDMNFPAGSTVLPMSDAKWVALKLESQLNQSHV